MVKEVAIISRPDFLTPFSIRSIIQLGSNINAAEEEIVRMVNVPYIATVGPYANSTDPMVQRYGLGGEYEGGAWNFAYGANTSPTKLNGVRSIHPLKSSQARLDGYRITFDHIGGMGNVVKIEDEVGSSNGSSLSAAHGVLHFIDHKDYAMLANIEHMYWPVEVDTWQYNGEKVRSVVFMSPPERRISNLLPPT